MNQMVIDTAPASVESWSGKDRGQENFPVGSRLLSREVRPHMHAYYAFARNADDIADSPDFSPEEKIARLDVMEEVLLGRRENGSPSATRLRKSLIFFKSSAQFTHSGRGMYVDKFFRTAKNTSGATVVNPVFSILGVEAKEDSLLNYAKANHITYLILYDLHYVFGNATFENYLCAFITKAKTKYCIEKIGAASSCTSLFDNVFSLVPTPPILFSDRFNASRYSSDEKNKLSIVETQYFPGDSLFYLSEATMFNMRLAVFNDGCAEKFDLMVSEYEFWNASVDDCLGDLPTKDQKYLRYQNLINNMDVIRDNYNSSHSTHQIYVETYLGYINQNAAYSHQAIANWIDTTYSGKRRVDRINNHYYGSDPSRLYSRTAAGQNNSGYYLTRFLDFCQSSTANQTNFHPIFSSEYIPWGAGGTYLGGWFSQNVNNNIFTAFFASIKSNPVFHSAMLISCVITSFILRPCSRIRMVLFQVFLI